MRAASLIELSKSGWESDVARPFLEARRTAKEARERNPDTRGPPHRRGAEPGRPWAHHRCKAAENT